MFNKYYLQELQNLRELAREFSRVHPASAPMLSETSSDPDVERLLEGVAFISGLLQRKLDDEFPEIIHSLMDVIFPHYLRPIPSVSIIEFFPKQGMAETIKVPGGTSLASIPVDGTKCIFRTCFDTEVHPLKLANAELVQQEKGGGTIRLTLKLAGINVSQWNPGNLRFFIGESYGEASNLFLLLSRYLRRIIIKPRRAGAECILPPDALTSSGFDMDNSLLPYPARSFAGYRLLQEYFLLPQKFLFMELKGWENWQGRGEGNEFEILFELKPAPIPPPRINRGHFHLFTVPVINLFSDDSDQFLLDHRMDKIRVRPASKGKGHYEVFSIDKVVGYEQGTVQKKEYAPLELFSKSEGRAATYQVSRAKSAIDDSAEYYLSFSYPQDAPDPALETLSLSMTYTNGALPERLGHGDIREQTSDSPGLLDFRNIIKPTAQVEPALGGNSLWKFLSHLSLNYLSLANAGNLRNLLELYIFPETKDRQKLAANQKRIAGILNLEITPSNRIVSGIPMRGQKIRITLNKDNFASIGDLYLFSSVLDLFFGVFSSMNSYTHFEVKDSISGEEFNWPVRIGTRALA